MPAAFSTESKRTTLALSQQTKERVKALILDLDMDATQVIELAVAQLWQRKIGEPDRDFGAELDELKALVAAIAPQKEQ